MRWLAAVAAASIVTVAGPAATTQPAPVTAEAALVVKVASPALFTTDGNLVSGVEERLQRIAQALDLVGAEPFGDSMALSVSPLLCDEIALVGTPAAGSILDALRTLAVRMPVLAEPHAHVRLPDLGPSSVVRAELMEGAQALERCIGREPADILSPPGGRLDENALEAAVQLGMSASLARVTFPQRRDEFVLIPVAFEPDDVADGSALVVEADSQALERAADMIRSERIRPVPLAELAAAARPTDTSLDPDLETPSSSYLQAWARADQGLRGLAGYTAEGNRLVTILTTVLARARSSADWDGVFGQGRRLANELLETIRREHGHVSVADGAVTFTSQSGSVPVTVSNAAAYPVRVRITVESAKLDFPAGRTREVVVSPPGDTITFQAVARSTGTFPTVVTLSSPDRSVVFDTTQLSVRSVAANLPAMVLTGGGAILLLAWVVRRLRPSRPPK